jgi:hypothetical protein
VTCYGTSLDSLLGQPAHAVEPEIVPSAPSGGWYVPASVSKAVLSPAGNSVRSASSTGNRPLPGPGGFSAQREPGAGERRRVVLGADGRHSVDYPDGAAALIGDGHEDLDSVGGRGGGRAQLRDALTRFMTFTGTYAAKVLASQGTSAIGQQGGCGAPCR